MVRWNRTDDKSRFHRARGDQLLEIVESGYADRLGEFVRRLFHGIANGDDLDPGLEKIEERLVCRFGAVARADQGDGKRFS